MKFLIVVSIFIFSISAQAQSLRSECQNAFYATGYVKLNQYTVTVSWEKVSDHAHVKLENILFDNFDIMSTSEVNSKTIYKIKENNSVDDRSYELLLEELKTIPVRVSCTFDV